MPAVAAVFVIRLVPPPRTTGTISPGAEVLISHTPPVPTDVAKQVSKGWRRKPRLAGGRGRTHIGAVPAPHPPTTVWSTTQLRHQRVSEAQWARRKLSATTGRAKK